MPQHAWVDFRAIKEAVTIRMALDHYEVNWLRKKGDELRGRCPIHNGEGRDTFHANLSKNAFQCFSCKARGNVLDFVAAMEQCTTRDAALKLGEWFSLTQSDAIRPKAAKLTKDVTAVGESRGEETAINKPLSFELKRVEFDHPYLEERGIGKDIAEMYGIGFFPGKGSMSGRIVVPIHNAKGELVAYAGRAINGEEPKYKLPAGFRKSLELFNLHRAIAKVSVAGDSTVVLVEGFFDCVKVHEAGYACVAAMGSSLSAEQEHLLCSHFARVVILFDGDDAGRAGTDDLLVRLGRSMWVKSVSLPDNVQPDCFSAGELQQLLSL